MSRIFYDPGTAAIAQAGMQVVGGIAGGQQARSQAEAAAINAQVAGQQANFAAQQRANDLDITARQASISTQRALRDLKKQRSRSMARTRAALAAQGADLASGTPMALQASQAAEFALQRTRIEQDNLVTQRTLEARAANERAMGRYAQQTGVTRAANLMSQGEAAAQASLLTGVAQAGATMAPTLMEGNLFGGGGTAAQAAADPEVMGVPGGFTGRGA
jgi:hypothetical protein